MAPHKLSWLGAGVKVKAGVFFWTKRKAKIDAKENKMLPRCEVSVILPVIEGEGERWERANAVRSVARERKGREYLRERHRA